MTGNVYQTREEKIRAAHNSRLQEVENYQINIDSYTLAIAIIDKKPDAEREQQSGFREQLVALLEGERREQAKSKVMLEAVEIQLGAGVV